MTDDNPADDPVLPDIRTERLFLRRMRREDLPAIVALYAVPASSDLDPKPLTGDELRAKFAVWVADWQERGLSYWVVEEPATGELLGMGGIRHHVEDGEPVLNLAYRLWPHAWGKGYAAELARVAVAWAEANLPHSPVSVVTTPQHSQSLRVAEKLGFTPYRERETHGFAEVLLRRPKAQP
jgi:RimJ/RimL family protein N-acetyltransferase